MSVFKIARSVLLLTFSLALWLPALAQVEEAPTDRKMLQTDWLDLVKGSRGVTMGAHLVDMQDTEEEGSQEVTLAIPKSSMGHPDTIEEVLVVGRMPEKSEPLDFSYEWVKDYDADNYGLVIRLSKDSNWPIRLRMHTGPGLSEQ